MKYRPNNYERLFGMSGFSRKLLESHFTLYQDYVDHTNELLETLSRMDKNAKAPEFAELKRRLGWEFNGMRLHELYFENLGGKDTLKKSPLQESIEKEFGGFAAWEKDFRATGALRGMGWAIRRLIPERKQQSHEIRLEPRTVFFANEVAGNNYFQRNNCRLHLYLFHSTLLILLERSLVQPFI